MPDPIAFCALSQDENMELVQLVFEFEYPEKHWLDSNNFLRFHEVMIWYMVHIVAKSSIDQTMYLRCLMHAQSWRLAHLLEPKRSNPRNFPIWGAKPRLARRSPATHQQQRNVWMTLPAPKTLKKHRNHRYCGRRTSCMKAILSSLSSLVWRTCQLKLEQQDYQAVEHQLHTKNHVLHFMLMSMYVYQVSSQDMIFQTLLAKASKITTSHWPPLGLLHLYLNRLHQTRKITEHRTEHCSSQGKSTMLRQISLLETMQ